MFKWKEHGIELPSLTDETVGGKRFYTTPEGNVYPSVTTVLASRPKDGLDEWRKRVGDTEANGIMYQAANHGSAVHDAAEKYIANQSDYADHLNYFNLTQWKKVKKVLDEDVDDILFSEVALYSDRIKVAGRVDLIAHYKDTLSIIDFKTSRKDKKEEWIEDYFMQESVYAACFYEMTGIPIKQCVTVICSEQSLNAQVYIVKPSKYLKQFIKFRKALLL